MTVEHRNDAEHPYAIVVDNLSKRYYLHRDRPRTLKQTLIRGFRQRTPIEYLWALRNISLRIPRGRVVGIVGPNGAGKSTLLRLIGGVGCADEGQITTYGQIGTLLDLGAGFHGDLTGRENVYVNGVISGLTREQIEQRFDSIVDFAELEDFIDSPLRTYSSGMQMRLGFAVAIHTDPDILLIDEVLAVGDLAFQQKCLERINRFKAEGSTILMVSHDANSIKQLCDEALWIRKGQLIEYGPADTVAQQYTEDMAAETRRRTSTAQSTVPISADIDLRMNENRLGSLEMEIVSTRLLDAGSFPVIELDSGDRLTIEIEYIAPHPVPSPIFGVTISHEDGTVCYDTATDSAKQRLPTLQGLGHISLQIDRLDLTGGQYYIDVGVYEQDWTYAYDYHWHVYPLIVRQTPGEKGILRPPTRWLIDDVPATDDVSDRPETIYAFGQV